MKRILLVVVALLVSVSVYAASPMQLWNGSAWVPALADGSGALVTSGSSGGSGGVASLGVGIAAESTTQIATGVTTALSSISSGSTPPMWITLRNVGLTTIHYSNGTPTDSSDGIAAGEQAAMYVSTNTPVLNMRAHSTGVSTLTVNIWK